MSRIFVYDPTVSDELSSVRGIGRYLQILKENFPEWKFVNNETIKQLSNDSIFINPFFNFLQPPLILKRISQKQIAVIHDLIPLKYPSHFPAGIRGSVNILLNKFALKNYDLLITDSEESKKDIANILRLPEEKIKVIYPCLPTSFSKLKIENSKLIRNLKLEIRNFCLYVGDATWNKNIVNIARAIKIADINCVFVGKIFDSKTRKLANSLNNKWLIEFQQFIAEVKDDKRFVFPGFLPDTDLFNLYKQASVNLLLSSAEGFGFSYLEAANFSCPSLLADIPVLREISDNQAIFANQNNPADIAKSITQIYLDQELRNKISSQAKKRSEYFSAEKFREKFLSII